MFILRGGLKPTYRCFLSTCSTVFVQRLVIKLVIIIRERAVLKICVDVFLYHVLRFVSQECRLRPTDHFPLILASFNKWIIIIEQYVTNVS